MRQPDAFQPAPASPLPPVRSGGNAHAPASTAVTAVRKASDERMINFSASTTRKKISPPASSQGQTHSGTASVPNIAWNGGV